MEKEANQLYRRSQMTGQARDEEEGGVRGRSKGSAHHYAPARGIAMQLIELSVQRLMTAT